MWEGKHFPVVMSPDEGQEKRVCSGCRRKTTGSKATGFLCRSIKESFPLLFFFIYLFLKWEKGLEGGGKVKYTQAEIVKEFLSPLLFLFLAFPPPPPVLRVFWEAEGRAALDTVAIHGWAGGSSPERRRICSQYSAGLK